MLQVDILTLFPEFFNSPLQTSIIGRSIGKDLSRIYIHDIRDFTTDKHRITDDRPYGGGPGMVMKAEPIFKAVESLELKEKHRIILTCPQGEVFDQKKANSFSKEEQLIIICGHYEGIDERVREHLITDEISIGDYVLTGGEIPALTIIDSVIRLLPEVLGNKDSFKYDSFMDGLLDCPHYTRPPDFRGWKVPDVLLSGHHKEIENWRMEQKMKRTIERRPDLLYE